jgi:hypothetical protein
MIKTDRAERLSDDQPAGDLRLGPPLGPGQHRLVKNLATGLVVNPVRVDDEIEHLVVDVRRLALQIPWAVAAVRLDPISDTVTEGTHLALEIRDEHDQLAARARARSNGVSRSG